MSTEPIILNCLNCKHCHVRSETSCYSEVTPGDPFEFGCDKNIWSLDISDTNKKSLVAQLDTAKSCRYFQPEKLP